MSAISHNCRNCGVEFPFPLECATRACPACGAIHGRPRSEGDSMTWLCRANVERAANDFANAEKDYREALGRSPEQHEALWGLVMCKYGVELVEGKPTIHFYRRRDILTDPDCVQAIALAPEEVSEQYQALAEYISGIQRGVVACQAEPCDVFLCYKDSGAQPDTKAKEFYHAYQLYLDLQKHGYRVFFAHETLKNEAGAGYEAQIYHALYAAPVMLLICSDTAHLDSPWIHSEWSRYLGRINDGEHCRLIPMLYDQCNPYRLPRELSGLQGIAVGESDWWGVLLANLEKMAGSRQQELRASSDEVRRALLPIEYALSNSAWEEAAALAETMRKEHPDCARGYLYKLLAKLKATTPEKLRERVKPFENEGDWQWAMRLATPAEKAAWTEILNASLETRRRKEEERRQAEEAKRKAAEQRRAEEEARQSEAARRAAEASQRAAAARQKEQTRKAEAARQDAQAQQAAKVKRAETSMETWLYLFSGVNLVLTLAVGLGMMTWPETVKWCLIPLNMAVAAFMAGVDDRKAPLVKMQWVTGMAVGLLTGLAMTAPVVLEHYGVHLLEDTVGGFEGWLGVSGVLSAVLALCALVGTIWRKHCYFAAHLPVLVWLLLVSATVLWPDAFAYQLGEQATLVDLILFGGAIVAALASAFLWGLGRCQEMLRA